MGSQTRSLQYCCCHLRCPHGVSLSHHPSLAIFLGCEHRAGTDPLVQVQAVFPIYKALQWEGRALCSALLCSAPSLGREQSWWAAKGRTWQSLKQNFLLQNVKLHSPLDPTLFRVLFCFQKVLLSPLIFSVLSVVNCICLLLFLVSHSKVIHGRGREDNSWISF